jgi:SAM-dependent methyltransferase
MEEEVPFAGMIAKFFDEGYWQHPLLAYRLWRTENRRWGSMKEVWEYVGRNKNFAFLMMNNSKDEEELQTSGGLVADGLKRGLNIESGHKVLEVGCGVARIGRELAPYCGEWWGCDISSSIIRIARHRTAHLKNVHFEVLTDCSLNGFPDDSFDRVYCYAVLMHMDQEDIFSYVQEMRRVMKPGGIVSFDAINLVSEEGWTRFMWEVEHYKDRQAARPIHHSRFSTPQELSLYAEKAGLGLLYCLEPKMMVRVIATKYPADCLTDDDQHWYADNLRTQVDVDALRF